MLIQTKKLAYYLLGAAILALAAVVAIQSKVGLGAFDAISYNGSLFFNTTVGISMNAHIVLLVILLMLIDFTPRHIFGAFIGLSVGIFIDVYHILFTLPEFGSFNFVYFIFALLLIPVGVTIMIHSSVPISPLEQLPLSLAKKYNVKYVYTKTAVEVCYVLIALLYSFLAGEGLGAVMLGTIIITFYIGPSVSFFRTIIPKIKEA